VLVIPIGVGRPRHPGGLRLLGTQGSSLGGAGVGMVEGLHGLDLQFGKVGSLRCSAAFQARRKV